MLGVLLGAPQGGRGAVAVPKKYRRRTKSGILGAPPKDEFWGSWDPAGSKEHQILHYMVKSRLPENSVRPNYENLRFLRPLRGPLEAQGTAGSPGRRGSQGGRGAVGQPKKCEKIAKTRFFPKVVLGLEMDSNGYLVMF